MHVHLVQDLTNVVVLASKNVVVAVSTDCSSEELGSLSVLESASLLQEELFLEHGHDVVCSFAYDQQIVDVAHDDGPFLPEVVDVGVRLESSGS